LKGKFILCFPSNVQEKSAKTIGALKHPTTVQVKFKQKKVTEDFAFK